MFVTLFMFWVLNAPGRLHQKQSHSIWEGDTASVSSSSFYKVMVVNPLNCLSFSDIGYLTKVKEPSLPYYSRIAWFWKKRKIHAFPECINAKWNIHCLVKDLNPVHRVHFFMLTIVTQCLSHNARFCVALLVYCVCSLIVSLYLFDCWLCWSNKQKLQEFVGFLFIVTIYLTESFNLFLQVVDKNSLDCKILKIIISRKIRNIQLFLHNFYSTLTHKLQK